MNKVYWGDCRDSMRDLIAQGVKVQMCVTSPPYFGLRDYGHPGQLGLESTPDEYVQNMVEVFRLVRELLSDDGVLWLNLGDSYAGSGKGPNTSLNKEYHNLEGAHSKIIPDGLKPKDLIGIPWRVAFALQADGWYLRQDIIWHKPNPMPESVTDRCTKAHEYMFLLSKNERYYYDHEAIKEGMADTSKARLMRGVSDNHKNIDGAPGQTPHSMNKPRKHGEIIDTPDTRNKRSVWTVATSPYSGAHFATFPPALIEPCILAGSRPGDIVLDPFFGSGTTGEVCQNLGRQWIGCELNPAYGELQQERTAQMGMIL